MTKSKKKIIHALTIIDKSSSMQSFRSRTIEGVNTNINALKKEVDSDTEILNTQLQFSATNSTWGNLNNNPETDFVFTRIAQRVESIPEMTVADYIPNGGTPLLDAIGYGIEKVKSFHGDKLGDDNLKIIVTIITDGEENSSSKWKNDDIKKMIDHFQSDGKWTFTFIGCGSFDAVSKVSAQFGVLSANTVAYAASEDGFKDAYTKVSTSYCNFARSAKMGVKDDDLFTEKCAPMEK